VDRISQNKLYWKCRRGLLELDLVLQRFLDKNVEEKDAKSLSDFLEMQDNELWDIVSGRSDRYEARFEGIVARLRAV